MGTRAVFTFRAHGESYHVYKHRDGYPEGAACFLTNAKKYAWKGDRFESADFAAAFIAGNKKEGGGDVYFTKGPQRHGDLEYVYEVYMDRKTHKPCVRAYEIEYDRADGGQLRKRLFSGTLNEFVFEHGDQATAEEYSALINNSN